MNGSPELKTQPSARNVIRHTGIVPAWIAKNKKLRGLKLAPLQIAIYGLFDRRNVCRYVGQTAAPFARRKTHRRKYNLRFRVLRQCEHEDAARLESQVIRAYKRKGQATLNKRIDPMPTPARTVYGILACYQLKLYFVSRDHAARFFKCTGPTIRKAMEKRNGEIMDFWLSEISI